MAAGRGRLLGGPVSGRAAAADVPAQAIPVDGPPFLARLVGVGPAWNLRFEAQGVERQLPAADLVRGAISSSGRRRRGRARRWRPAAGRRAARSAAKSSSSIRISSAASVCRSSPGAGPAASARRYPPPRPARAAAVYSWRRPYTPGAARQWRRVVRHTERSRGRRCNAGSRGGQAPDRTAARVAAVARIRCRDRSA